MNTSENDQQPRKGIKRTNHFVNLKDSLELRNFRKTKFTLKPKTGTIQSRNANLIINTGKCEKDNSQLMIDTPRFEPNQEHVIKKINELEKKVYDKDLNWSNKISDMQKQINWLTSTVYTLTEQNEVLMKNNNSTDKNTDKKDKALPDFPPGLPITKSKLFQQNLKMMQNSEPSSNTKNDFYLFDAEIDMINSKTNEETQFNKYPNRNVITPINECFTPDSCDSPFISCQSVTSPNKSR